MDTEQEIIPFDEFVSKVTTIFEQVASGKRVTVERDGALFLLRAARRRSRHLRQKPRGLTPTDPLLEIIGLGGNMDVAGPTDVSSNKHKYLAEAAADLHEPESAKPERQTDEPRREAGEDHDASSAL